MAKVSKNPKKAYRQRQLRRIYLRDGGICATCGLFVEEIDATRGHIKPMSQGGSESDSNIVLEHATCNRSHGDIPIGVTEVDYAVNLWLQLFAGVEIKLDKFIWAMKLLKIKGDTQVSEAAEKSLLIVRKNKVGNTLRLHTKNRCEGLVSYSKPKYGDAVYRYPCTSCGEIGT